MAGSINKVTLIGHLGKDPEIRSMQNGGKVCNLSLATSESWKDKGSGERKTATEWHKIAIFNDNIVGFVERYLKKGAHVYIEGRLETRKWTNQAGQDHYSTEIVLRPYGGELIALDGGPDGGQGGARGGRTHHQPRAAGEEDSDVPF